LPPREGGKAQGSIAYRGISIVLQIKINRTWYTYSRVDAVIDAMASEVILRTTVSCVGFRLALVETLRHPSAELLVVSIDASSV
jgi:hypothetical protein